MPVATCARVSTERQERQQTIDSHLAALRACRRAPCGCRCIRRRDAVPGHLVVDEAEVVRMIYGWLTDGGTAIRQVLKRLIPTRVDVDTSTPLRRRAPRIRAAWLRAIGRGPRPRPRRAIWRAAWVSL